MLAFGAFVAQWEETKVTMYRYGAVGALMDEYERATRELAAILDGVSGEAYERIRDSETNDEDCRSIQTIVTHVVRAGHGYAALLADAWGKTRIGAQSVAVASDRARTELEAMLESMIATLDGKWELSDEEAMSLRIQARWGPIYDFEQLFEHAIVHVLRHRRQIERFLSE